MINIQEIDGVLHRIIETKIDNFNTKRTAVPITEEEFENISASVEKHHASEKAALSNAKAKGGLKKKAQLDKVADRPEPVREAVKKDVLNKKQFSVG